MNNKLLTILLSATALLSYGSQSIATVIYSDRTLFEDSLVSLRTDTYETGYANFQNDAQMTAVINETRYTSTGFNNLNIVTTSGNKYYCAGCNGSFLLDFTESNFVTGQGVYGAGFDFLNGKPLFSPSTEFYSAFITYGDGSTENFALDTTSGFNFDFFGITSDLKIASIHLGKDNGVSTTSQNGYFALDNLTIGSDIAINVPLPSSLALMGLGLIILSRRSAR